MKSGECVRAGGLSDANHQSISCHAATHVPINHENEAAHHFLRDERRSLLKEFADTSRQLLIVSQIRSLIADQRAILTDNNSVSLSRLVSHPTDVLENIGGGAERPLCTTRNLVPPSISSSV